jgi:RimJ/RimL family protein N-acetyltransferase
MTVSVREFNHFDVNDFDPLPGIFGDDAKRRTVDAARYGAYVYTFFDEEGVIGVAGCTPIWAGLAEVWTILGEGINRDPKGFSARVGETIDHVADMLTLIRIQAHVKVGHAAGVKWIERFGFIEEGIMKNYLGKGVDAHLYARCV